MFSALSRYQPQLLGLFRIVAGLLFLAHGVVKMFGFPPGAMPGVQDPMTLLGVAGIIELIAGVLILIGLFTRPAAFIASGEMAVAYWMFHVGEPLSGGERRRRGDPVLLPVPLSHCRRRGRIQPRRGARETLTGRGRFGAGTLPAAAAKPAA